MSTGVARGGVLLALVAAALAQNCDPQMDPDCAYETHTGGGSTTGGDGDCVDDPVRCRCTCCLSEIRV